MLLLEVVRDEFDEQFEKSWREVIGKLGYKEMAKHLPQGGGSVVFPFSLFIPGAQDETFAYRGELSFWGALQEAKKRVKDFCWGLAEANYEKLNGENARAYREGRDHASIQAYVTTQRWIAQVVRTNRSS